MRKVFIVLFLVLVLATNVDLKSAIKPVRTASLIIVPDDYPSIREAIGAASDGDTIFVKNGTYYEYLPIWKSVSLVGENPHSTIIDGGGALDVIAIGIGNVAISNFTIQNGLNTGLSLCFGWARSRNNIVISNNIVTKNRFGCEAYVTGSVFVGNTFFNNTSWGLRILEGNNTVSNNKIMSNRDGLVLGSSRNKVVNNRISNNRESGMSVVKADESFISNNTILDNGLGISLGYSYGLVLRNNNMTNNRYNLHVTSYSIDPQDIDTTNTVNGKPVYYWINETNKQIPLNAGYVVVINSWNITAKNLNLSNNGQGVLFADTHNSAITNVNCSYNEVGICLNGDNNTISYNIVSSNGDGVWIYGNNNAVSQNTLTENSQCGIRVTGSGKNSVDNNLLSGNGFGICLEYTTNNTLRSNNMTDNTYNFDVTGEKLAHYINNVDISNSANGRPIYYLINQHKKSVPADAGHVVIVNSTEITVENLTLTKNKDGVLLAFTTNSTVKNVNAMYCVHGIRLYQSHNNTISDCKISDNKEYGISIRGMNNTALNCFVSNCYWFENIAIFGTNNKITHNILTASVAGVGVYGSNNIVSHNILTNNYYGIWIPNNENMFEIGFQNNTLSYNVAENCSYGILIGQNWGIPEAVPPSANVICNNIVANNINGLVLERTEDDLLYNNIIANNSFGFLVGGYNNTLRNNVIFDNTYNFEIDWAWRHKIDASNTINGKPIVYLVDESDVTVEPSTFPQIGYLGIVDSKNVTVRNLTLSNSGRGILLVRVTNSTIKNVTVSNNIVGVYILNCMGITVLGSTVADNRDNGFYLSISEGNIFESNLISGNSQGFYIYGSDANIIRSNTMRNNLRSITVDYSSENIIYHNNFINNTSPVHIYPMDGWTGYFSKNEWDNGFEGNYWSDYAGKDVNNDGIGDTPYIINENNTDRYPLTGTFTSFNIPTGHSVNVISNSTINDFTYFGANKTIIMHVSNTTTGQTYGFCRVCIPHALMNQTYSVIINGSEPYYWNYSLYDNGTYRWIYFSYQHSTLEVIIIPEFPSFLILPLFTMATLIAVIVHRKKHIDIIEDNSIRTYKLLKEVLLLEVTP